MSETRKITLNVDDIGLSKFYQLNFNSSLRAFQSWFRQGFDYLDELRIKRIKRLAQLYDLPVTWAVVPYYLNFYPFQKIRFDKALPKIYRLIKKYSNNGDEIIQHGNCHFYFDQNYFSHEEFCPRNKNLSLNQQKTLLQQGWQALVKMGLKPKKIIQFPGWRADNQSIKAALRLHYQGVLAKNLLYPQTAKTKFPSSYQLKLDKFNPGIIDKINMPINLLIHPSQKNEYQNLRRALKFLQNKPVKFIKLSQSLQVY